MTVYYAGDFETTVNEQETEVWLSCFVNVEQYEELNNFVINTNIKDFFKSLYTTVTANYKKTGENDYVIFFHNLKFDGSFILNFLDRKSVV